MLSRTATLRDEANGGHSDSLEPVVDGGRDFRLAVRHRASRYLLRRTPHALRTRPLQFFGHGRHRLGNILTILLLPLAGTWVTLTTRIIETQHGVLLLSQVAVTVCSIIQALPFRSERW